MPPVELAGAMRTTFVWGRPQDDEIVQTFHTRRLATVSLPNLTQYAQDMYDWLSESGNAWRALMFQQYDLQRVITYDLEPGSAMAGEASGETMGSRQGVSGPHQVAVCVTWLTQYRGAQYRGRTYVGPAATSWIDTSGYVTSNARDEIAGAAAVLLGKFYAMDTDPVVASFTRPGIENIVGVAVDNSPDVIRRRQLRATARTHASPAF